MPIIRAPGAARRSQAVKTAANDAKQERQQIKALATDLQTIVDGIQGNAEWRGPVKDIARAVRRLVRLVD